MGSPKPIVNIFKSEIKQENGEAVEVLIAERSGPEPEEEANTIIEDAKMMYLKIIEEANSEAQTIRSDVNQEAQSIMSRAREDGYREGFDAGYLEGRKEAQAAIDEAVELRSFIDERKDALYVEVEEQVVQLVLAISRKIIGDEISQNNEAILSLINNALQKCAFKKKLILRVSHQDSKFVIENKDRICMLVEGISDIEIQEDLSLAKGSCQIETPSGEIDSSIEVQMKEVEKIFTYLLRNE